MVRRILTSRWTQFLVLMVLVVTIAIIATDKNRVTETLRNYAFDQFNRWDEREPTDQVIIVDIDENSLRDIGQWPWPRDVIAELVLNLSAMGAKSIAFDMVFAEPDRMSPSRFAEGLVKKGLIDTETQEKLAQLPDNDEILSEAFRRARNVVTGFTYAKEGEMRNYPAYTQEILIKKNDEITIKGKVEKYRSFATNHDQIIKNIAGSGTFIARPDSDGRIRKMAALISMEISEGSSLYPTLGLESLRVAYNKKEQIKVGQIKREMDGLERFLYTAKEQDYMIRIGTSGWDIPIKSNGKVYLKYRKLDRSRDYISAKDVIQNADGAQNRIKDKIVLIGTSAEGLRDIRNTAIAAFIPGVEVHFNFIEQVLQNKFLFRDGIVSSIIEMGVILFCGTVIVMLSLYLGLLPLIVSSVAFIAAIGFGCFYLYRDHDLLCDSMNTSLAVFIIFVAATILNYMRSEITRREIKSAFGQYISPEFMAELTENPEKLTLGGEMRDLTVMFTDIRNFTTISERLTPDVLINTMNDFLTPMSDVVMKTRGTIDKYMGDAMMAFWNAPLDDADHARHAVDAALAMKAALEPVNADLRKQADDEEREPLQLAAGIGINTGPCAVGNMGSKQRFAYSALGDAVNLASRLEGQTKSYGLELLIGEQTAAHIPDYAVIDIDLIQVKGKTQPVKIYTVLGNETVMDSDEFQSFLMDHNTFMALYRAGDFAEAEKAIEACLSHDIAAPYHAYYTVMADRIAAYKKTPPQNWNGVFVATSK